MRRRLGIAAVTLSLALAGLIGVATTPAGADATHTVTVTPSSGLSDGQTVTVSGTGFTETPVVNDWSVTQCSAAVLTSPVTLDTAINECNQAQPIVFTHADFAGNVGASLVVHRTFTAGSGAGAHSITCGQAPGDCAVLVSQLTTGGILTSGAAAISFGTLHTLTVTPSTGLRDGQTVTVTGTGFVEKPVVSDWTLTMCSPDILTADFTIISAIQYCSLDSPPFTGVPPSADGVLTASLTVTKQFSTRAGTVTCGQAPNDCVVILAQLAGPAGFVGATAPVSFGQPVPTLRDCIRTFLADHQHRPAVKLHRLLVCIWTAVANKRR
jgi:hypothetical protein